MIQDAPRDNPCNGEGESRFATSSAKGAESHQLHPCGSKDKSRALGPKIEMDKFNREEPCSSSKKPGCKKSRANEKLSNLAKPTIYKKRWPDIDPSFNRQGKSKIHLVHNLKGLNLQLASGKW